jgi:hypothetical protein
MCWALLMAIDLTFRRQNNFKTIQNNKMKLLVQIKQHKLFQKNKHWIRKLLLKKQISVDPSKHSVMGSLSFEDEKGIKHAITLAEKYEGPIIEIGTLFGHTTNLIGSLAKRDIKIITVDNFKWNPFSLTPAMHKLFTERTLRYLIEHRNTSLITSDAALFYQQYNGTRPSMVFIDADHSYDSVILDIKWAKNLNIPVISGHDFSDEHPGIQKAVREVFGTNFSVYGTVWIANGM